MKENIIKNNEEQLFGDVCHIIDDTRYRVASYANTGICFMRWQVGKCIKEDFLYNQRGEYGKQIVENLALKLIRKYGRGWGFRSLQHCVRVAYNVR